MPKIKLIDPVQDPRWDKFVQSHPFGWICHLSGWKTVLEKSFKHMKGYYYVLLDNKGDKIKAGLPVYSVKSWLTGNRLVSIPFATLCDPLISTSDDIKELTEAVLNLSRKLKSQYLEIRTLSSSSLFRDSRLARTQFYKHHYLRLESDPEQLKRKFHRSCVRQRISRAEKNGLKIGIGENESAVQGFYHLHMKTRQRLGLPIQPYVFFKNLWEEFAPSKRIQILFAEKDGKRIAGIITFRFRDRVSIEFLSDDEEFLDMSPNHFLFWETIKSAYEQGYKIVDFGRTSPVNKSLMDFKRRWGAEIAELPHFYYPENAGEKMSHFEESWKYKQMSKICQRVGGSFQKIVGNFCYHHLG